MYQNLNLHLRYLHHKLAIMLAMLIVLLSAVGGRRTPEYRSLPTLKIYSNESNNGTDGNTSTCLLSYSKMDRRELSKCKQWIKH